MGISNTKPQPPPTRLRNSIPNLFKTASRNPAPSSPSFSLLPPSSSRPDRPSNLPPPHPPCRTPQHHLRARPTYTHGLICLVNINETTTPRLIPYSPPVGYNDTTLYRPNTASTHPEANQPKYVCHRLRRETLRLELQYNDLIFHYHSKENPDPGEDYLGFTIREAERPYIHGFEKFAWFYTHC
ncbi:hypothetical protein K458DRAFT_437145 [Lentithecium fluviatile CBS 122367]|uniref:Uncharacterized protein n=1 Tax=Lentithecium fluviatile CBS 122367 TaxID=1168545 RepID=A0A6G1IET6_9PLEO|nr:hypothetical protein K458DRAFT_437145 [Lentithecium fluviatile CBS 122367]